VTGKLIPPAAQPLPLPPQTEGALSTSGEGLRETPGTTRGGGIKIDLQRLFRSTVTARIKQDVTATEATATKVDALGLEAQRFYRVVTVP
jgi:hypothetical protein